MPEKLGRGPFGSLRRRVAHETRLHRKENAAMRRARYSLPQRAMRALLSGHSFGWFVGIYAALALLAALAVAVVNFRSHLVFSLGDAEKTGGFLKDATSYLIATQVGLLAVVSVAIGLVTLIAQKDDQSSTNTDVQLYYSGALAYEVVASGVALLLVLTVQIFWPLYFVLEFFGLGRSELLEIALTVIHVLWLALNIGAFAQFVAMTLRFVEPKAREHMRERYTANVLIQDDLSHRLLRWLYLTGQNVILPRSEDQNSGVLLALGHSLGDTGEVDLTVNISGPSVLVDVRVALLEKALRRWWDRLSKAGLPDPSRTATLGRHITLAVLPTFDSVEEGTMVWCRRSGGLALDEWERRLMRWSFKYRRAPLTERDLPSPGNFIEELADKVIGQIEKLATTGFKSALNELLRYHKFLLDLYASRSGDGKPLSLAQFGNWFEQPHQEWAHHYRRIFERSVERLVEDPQFAQTMAHVSYRLLPSDAAEHSPVVVEAILDIQVHLVVLLEAWVTRRTFVDAAQPRRPLAGSDQRVYDQFLMNSVGAWENTVGIVGSLYDWTEARGDPARLWRSYANSWRFLERHLRNTAYFLAYSVWNEDAVGEGRYRDMLLKWLDAIHMDRTFDFALRHETLLTPDLLESEWTAVVERLGPFRRAIVGAAPSPQPIFDAILQRAFDDIIVLTAAMTLSWHMHEQQVSDIGGQTADRILRGQIIDDQGTRRLPPGGQQLGIFRRVIAVIIRESLMEGLTPRRYGTRLDDFVRYVGQMAERPMVPGRVYSMWGMHGVDSIAQSMLAMLLAAVPETGNDGLVEELAAVASNEDLFADGDEALRRIQFDLDALVKRLADQAGQPALERGFRILVPAEKDFQPSLVRLQTILTDAMSAMEQRRDDRLKARPVDQAKLDKIRESVEGSLGSIQEYLPVFRGFTIVPGTDEPATVNRLTFTGIRKGELVTPFMSSDTGLPGVFAQWVAEHLSGLVWRNFFSRPRRRIRIAQSRYPAGFWKKVIETAAPMGDDAVLLVPYQSIGDDLSHWLYSRADERPKDLNIKVKEGHPTGGGAGYLGTVQGSIDVFMYNGMPSDRALLLSAKALRSISHARLKNGHRIDITFDEAVDPSKSAIVVHFVQTTEWDVSPIIEFVLRAKAVPEAAPAAAPGA